VIFGGYVVVTRGARLASRGAMLLRSGALALVASVTLLAACEPEPDPIVPSPDAAIDAAAPDAAPPDAAPPDAAAPDAALADAEVPDAAESDAAPTDAARVDATPPPPDATPADAAPPPAPDASLPDAGPPLGGFVIAEAYRPGGQSSFVESLVRIPLDGGPAIDLSPTSGWHIFHFDVTRDGQVAVHESYAATPDHTRTIVAVRTDGASAPVDLVGPRAADETVHDMTLSPRGDRVAYILSATAGSRLVTVRLDGSDRVVVSGAHKAALPVWSPDGESLLYINRDSNFVDELTLTCADRDCSHSPLPGKWAYSPSYSPDGAHVLVSVSPGDGTRPSLWTVDVASGDVHELAAVYFNLAGSLRWSADGQRLAYFTGSFDDSTLHLACADGSCDTVMPLPAGSEIRADEGLEFSPDGRYLSAVLQDDNHAPLRLFVTCTDGTCVHEHAVADDHSFTHPAWSPEGLLVHRGKLPGSSRNQAVVDCALGDCPRQSLLGGADTYYRSPRWWAGSTRFATSGSEGIFVGEGIGQAARHLPTGPASDVAFDVSGQRLVFQSVAGVESIRIDGSDRRVLDASLSAPARLSPYQLEIR
jgi:Tol biopolymer transport system component